MNIDWNELGRQERGKSSRQGKKKEDWDLVTPGEEEQFAAYMEARLIEREDGSWDLINQVVPKWAVIQWDKAELSSSSARTKLMPLRYKAELSSLSARTKLIPPKGGLN
jgi:hypothetical protein